MHLYERDEARRRNGVAATLHLAGVPYAEHFQSGVRQALTSSVWEAPLARDNLDV